jgi:hypothetical protein
VGPELENRLGSSAALDSYALFRAPSLKAGVRNHFRSFVLVSCYAERADGQFFDVVGSRSKWRNCATDDEADARRQKRASRSRTNGQRKDTCCFRSYRKSNGWCFGQRNSPSISTACSGKCEAAGQAQFGPKPKPCAQANPAPTEVA